jgi:uncharacterized membrane protein YfcA
MVYPEKERGFKNGSLIGYDRPSMLILFLVCCAAFIAAGLNAIAGGGTFLAFPVLTGLAGLTEKAANVACTIGLWPGSASAVAAVRGEFRQLPRGMVIGYTLAALAGGFLGAELLLHTSEVTFRYAIPWLLAFATTVFAMGQRVAKWARRDLGKGHSPAWSLFVGFIQFVLSIYGGYFGAGMGVLTLAGLSLVGLADLRQINVLKVLLSTATNLTAAIVFLFGPVRWHFVGPMAISSVVGGFVGMNVAQRLPQAWLRRIILTIGILLTAAYFWKVYLV